MFRSGGFLAWHHFNVQPDIVVIAKALSGGLVPIGAVLMTDAAYKPVVVCGEERRKPASGADGLLAAEGPGFCSELVPLPW